MIAFASLWVGFVIGVVNVQLIASEGVSRVELILDGRPVAELRAPFAAPLDLGCEPSPHELVAVAYDAEGRELDRARQWVNRPRPTAEASLVLEGGRGGSGRVAQLTWRALAREAPASVTATFDGTPIPVSDPARIELPPHEPAQIHFLKTVLEFGEGVSATAELIFGGSKTVEAYTELTAMVVELERKASLPPVEAMAGWFEEDGIPLEVAAVDAGGVDIVIVAEGSARKELKQAFRRESLNDAETAANLRNGARFKREDLRFRFLWPVGRLTAQTEMVANVYPSTPWLSRKRSSIGRAAGWLLDWPGWTRDGQRLADAVVVAGLTAAEANRKRAVVLLLGPAAKDGSLLTPDEARSFLRRLGVPLEVWSIGKRSPEMLRWNARTLISAYEHRQFDDAVRDLLEAVDRQRIVWLEGSHLPHEIETSRFAHGIRRVQ
jgi:hypothetical protein